MCEKDITTKATNGEEDIEFGAVKQLPDGRLLSNVRNNSHEEPGEHIYPLFFRVEETETGIEVRVVGCGCPADEYHSGPCKHREAASESAELLSAVLALALNSDDEGEIVEEEDSATVDGEREQSGRTAIADGGREIGEWANRGGMPCPHRMSAAIELVRRWAIEYDEAKAFLQDVGFLEDGGGNEKKLATDGGQPEDDDCVCDKLGGLPCYHCVQIGRRSLDSDGEGGE